MSGNNERWNFIVNVFDVAVITTGINMVSQATIMPLLVRELTDSKIAVGLIPAIHSLGYLLPQLLTANFTERLPRKKPFVMLVSATGERMPYILTGILVWLLGVRSPGLTLAGFYLLLAIAAVSAGACTPAWYDMIAKVIPIHRRGLWAGTSRGIGALLSIGSAAVAGWFLAHYAFPLNFALCYAGAAVFVTLSFVGLSLNREPSSPSTKPRVSLSSYLGQLPAILRRDKNYVRFLIGRSIAALGGMGAGFFIVYGADRFGVSGQQVGTLTALLVGTQAVMNIVLGTVADRLGHKVVLALSALAMGLAALSVLFLPSAQWLPLTFVLLGISIAGNMVSNLNIILEFCTPEDRPTYIGLTNTLLAPATTLAPIIGGWLATTAGYQNMFGVALLCALVGGLSLAIFVRDPRRSLAPVEV